jgi:hypothetical protein
MWTHCTSRRIFLTTLASFLLATSCGLAQPPTNQATAKDNGNLIVHEWGTFLSVQGSDGVTLGGMVDSEEVLPSFVEARSFPAWLRSTMYQKMETPVTYFYTDRPRDVQVQIDMPKGILTHWYPLVWLFGPGPPAEPNAAANSFLAWRKVHLIAPNGPAEQRTGIPSPSLKPVGKQDTWRFARETDAALLRVCAPNLQGKPEHHFEKFLFYRGLGTFSLPLQVVSTEDSSRGGLVLRLQNGAKQPLTQAFAVSVEKNTIRFAALGDLPGGASRDVSAEAVLSTEAPLDDGVSRVKEEVATALVSGGLYPKEARAMVNTWEKSYFRTDGLRLLYVLPRQTVDSVIPIEIKPVPDQLVRVMVGRVEVLTPQMERQIESYISRLGDKQFNVRHAASDELARLGRITEPVLRRVAAKTTDPEVRARARALISQQSPAN